MSESGSLDRVLDVSIRRRWPRPVALAWGRVAVAREPYARLEALIRFSEVLFRTLAVVGIADYLAGEPSGGQTSNRNHPEALLRKLTRPADGDWHKLACLLPIACRARPDGAFMPELADWLASPHPIHEDHQRAFGWLVKLRNDARHGSGNESPSAVAAQAAEYEALLRELLGQLHFLGDYRFVRVVSATAMSVEGSFRGAVDVWAGTDEIVERIDTIWRGWLPAGSVYLIAPDARRALLVSPLVQIRDSEANRIERFFLLKKIGRSGLVLADDRHGEVLTLESRADAARDGGVRAWFDPNTRRRTEITDVEGRLHARAELRQFGEERLAGKYTLHEVLGRGGMGTVFRATHEILHKDVALKVLNPELTENPTVKERFLREARLMDKLQSPNVLRALDTGHLSDGHLYIASDIADGGSVADILADGPVEGDQVSAWITQAASGLAAIHSLGVVHRDIKPANLLIQDGRLLVSDLGIAREGTHSDLTRTHDQLGTGPYMSPEQHRGTPATYASDVYALGVVAHEMLTGSRTDWPYGRGVPGKLGALIRQMCDEDPKERPSALDVARVLSDVTVPAPAPSPTPAAAASRTPTTHAPSGPATPHPPNAPAHPPAHGSSAAGTSSARRALEPIGPPTTIDAGPPEAESQPGRNSWGWAVGFAVVLALLKVCAGS